ncbi:hypothetical protein D9M70_413690 [compost metagenome]
MGHDRCRISLAYHQLARFGARLGAVGGEVGLLAKAAGQWFEAHDLDRAVAARHAVEEVLQ